MQDEGDEPGKGDLQIWMQDKFKRRCPVLKALMPTLTIQIPISSIAVWAKFFFLWKWRRGPIIQKLNATTWQVIKVIWYGTDPVVM